ncbi:hypothetical protein MPTK2_1g25610 [Marchantia polymorpha subsp. ruderalis]
MEAGDDTATGVISGISETPQPAAEYPGEVIKPATTPTTTKRSITANVNTQNAIPWNSSGRMRNTILSPQEPSGPRIGRASRRERTGTLAPSDPNCMDEHQQQRQRPKESALGPTTQAPPGSSTATRNGTRVGPRSSQISVRVVAQSNSIKSSQPNEPRAEMEQLQLSSATRAKIQQRQQEQHQRQSRQQAPSVPGSSIGPRPDAMWIPLDVREARSKAIAMTNTSDLYLWRTGPADSAGVALDLSDRPLMCMSVRGTEAAIGCSDHSVYTVDVATGKKLRNLYSKKYGHTEWVTCVEHLDDGRILSGALDSKLCLWDATGVRCADLTGHDGSISAVKVIDSTYAVSASYDKTLMLWNLNGAGRRRGSGLGAVGCLQGHKGAVLGFAVSSHGALMSGSRDGEVFSWDATTGRAVLRCKNAHQGHVTAVECLRDVDSGKPDEPAETAGASLFSGCLGEIFVTGGQDGIIQVWDIRNKAPVHTFAVSRSEHGRGAVSNIGFTNIGARTPPLMITACADKIIRALEPRSSFRTVHTFAEHKDFIYSLHLCGPLMWSGAGDGKLLVHDLTNGRCLYGLGATNDGAVRCISLAGPRHLVIAGDDGNCMMYSV